MHLVTEEHIAVIRMAQMWRGGMGATPILPRAGGWLDQPAALMDAISHCVNILSRLDTKKG